MYSTCLHCTHPLGANDIIETLPVGRRLAFDSAVGRLWVICRSCARWNLVPFDNRLESIDACERIFQETRTRYSTDNIGLARAEDGLDLIRIGPALRPEFAAWRYGDRFASRRRRNLIIGVTVGIAAIGALAGVAALAGSAIGVNVPIQAILSARNQNRVVARIAAEGHDEALAVSIADIKKASLVRAADNDQGWGLQLSGRVGVTGRWMWGKPVTQARLLIGPDAIHALGTVLPAISGVAGSRRHVADAVGLIDANETMMGLVVNQKYPWSSGGALRPLGKIVVERRLALEMLANEESERRWMEGELKLLERQWKEADKLAGIADGIEADLRLGT